MVNVNPEENNINITVTTSGTSASTGVNYGAEIYSERAKEYALQASTSATSANVSKNNSSIWAEGTDTEVQELGGVHSSKGWAEEASLYGVDIDLSNLSATGESHFQTPLVSGTNIKTINSNSILGSGNLDIDALPSQTGQNGKYLTTDGSSASWGVISGGANTDLSNLSAMGENHFDNKYVNATALSEINPMITSYINGTSGYNIWANGFCEQWGHWGSGEGTATITFTKTYRDTSYQIFIAQYGNPYDYGYWGDIGEKSTIGFKYYSRFSAGSDWRTYGYLAEGQYTPTTIKGVNQ